MTRPDGTPVADAPVRLEESVLYDTWNPWGDPIGPTEWETRDPADIHMALAVFSAPEDHCIAGANKDLPVKNVTPWPELPRTSDRPAAAPSGSGPVACPWPAPIPGRPRTRPASSGPSSS